MTTISEGQKRSVDNLQRLYTVVVSLAVTESLKRIFAPTETGVTIPSAPEGMMVTSLIATLIPFYHGANRYLDATYITGERAAKHYALMLDFFALFVEGLLFFVLAMLIRNERNFYIVLSILLIFDSLWVVSTLFSKEKIQGEAVSDPKIIAWALLNIVSVLVILFFLFSNIWPTEDRRRISALVVVILRTVIDYILLWSFYYPYSLHKQKEQSAGSVIS
jgi:hypothetical protein